MLIRGLILATWLLLLAVHIVRHAAPGLGLGQRNTTREVFTVQIGRTLHYRLVGPDGTRMGTLSCAFREESGHFVQEFSASFDPDSPLVAQARVALTAVGAGDVGNGHSNIAGQVEVDFDDRFRPTAVQVHAMAFGIPLTAELALDHRGMTGWYLVAGSRQTVAMTDIDPSSLTGLDLSLALPPDLRPGDAWTTRSLATSGMRIAVQTVVHTVVGAERITTAAGPTAAVKVTSGSGGQAAAVWVDARGTALRAEAAGLRLDLDRIVAADGTRLWPPP